MILTHLDIFVGTLTSSHLYKVKLVLYLSCPILPNCKNASNSTHTIVAMVVKQQIETNLYVSSNARIQLKSNHCLWHCLCHCQFKCNFRDIHSNVAMILTHQDVLWGNWHQAISMYSSLFYMYLHCQMLQMQVTAFKLRPLR
jgi:hypothetical protein